MDCTIAAPFVSMLCDGMAVPDDAARHIAGCTQCQAQLRDWAEAGARLRVLAAADRLAPLPALALEPHTKDRQRIGLTRSWLSPMRVPRLAVALLTLTLVVSWVGWYRAQTASRILYELHYEITLACSVANGAAVRSAGSGMSLVPSRSTMFTGDACIPAGGLLGLIESVRVHDGIVTLRLGFSTGEFKPGTMPKVDLAAVHEYEYIPGQTIEIAVPGAPPVTFKATLVQRADTPRPPATIEALIPKPDELVVAMPALIKDGHEVVVTMNAGTTIKRGEVAKLYAPGVGLFQFGLDRFEGATQAMAGGAALMFEADGHKYLLYSSLPMTAGEQPHTVWVRYISGYRPSQHSPFGNDDLPSLGNGTPDR